ncbi:unnamed protein product [Phaedon cochleariae]|uniref:FP protein C-terminal domain-containing protein n=1 Tax=Phaedon cochleariae TaxID=80249 RepID=A0A9N9X4L3_PHACE|nr:unnamed protein product [Phaedon cochleariae]
MTEMMDKINIVLADVTGIKCNQTEVMDSLKFYGDKIDDFTRQMETVEVMMKDLNTAKQEILFLKNECSELRSEVQFLQQQSRAKNVEISGIPERKGEIISQVIKNVGVHLGINIVDSELDEVHRVMRHPSATNINLPKNIVIKFSTITKRNQFIQAYRHQKKPGKMYTIDFGIEGPKQAVFVKEHLSPYYKILYKETREFCSANQYKYCWIKDSKIFIKKDHGRAIQVKDETTLQRLN